MRSDRYREDEKPRKNHKTLKIMLVLIVLLITAIAGIIAYSYKSTLNSLNISFKDESPEVEFGGEYTSMDYVKNSSGDVSASAVYLDADTLGNKEVVYTVSQPIMGGLMTPEQEYTLTYTVVDTIPPLMLKSGDGTVLERGTEFDINNVIGYGDNADPAPSLTVDGEVDMDTEGSYPLHVTVTDSSGNKTDWDLTVRVAAEVPVYQDTSERTAFADFASSHDDGAAFGIDVSAWQGDVDYAAVKESGCSFVMIRIGYSSDGEVTIDSKFEQNLKRAKEAGLKVGIYLYSYDNTVEKVRASAEWIVEKLAGEQLDLPVVFDWEDFQRFQTYNMSFTQLNNMYDEFSAVLSDSGYDCMLYSSKFYLENVWTDTDMRPVWLAHYTDKTDYSGSYRMWQASCTGRISGIDGDVDMDILY